MSTTSRNIFLIISSSRVSEQKQSEHYAQDPAVDTLTRCAVLFVRVIPAVISTITDPLGMDAVCGVGTVDQLGTIEAIPLDRCAVRLL